MTSGATDIKTQFVQLEKSEQVELMQFFLHVIAENDWQLDGEDGFLLDNSTKAEIDRRYENLRSGKDKGFTPTEFSAYLDQQFSTHGIA